MNQFRQGDQVTITAVVTLASDNYVHVRPVDHYTDLMLKPEQLTLTQPKIQNGDFVNQGWEVLGIHEASEQVWISKGTNFTTIPLNQVTRDHV